MALKIYAFGRKMPAWVQSGFDEYAKRLPAHLNPSLIELKPSEAATADARKTDEARALFDALPKRHCLIALDERAPPRTTSAFSVQLERWLQSGSTLCFAIGGADGFAPSLLTQAHATFSLGPLTLPHPLVRVVLIEQIYRAHTLLSGHPYHRA
jgi:23S rRNA (pseudouridine1915-N3)-methyltransferase